MRYVFLTVFTVLLVKLLLTLPAYYIGDVINTLSIDSNQDDILKSITYLTLAMTLMFILSPVSVVLVNKVVQTKVENQSITWIDKVLSIDLKTISSEGVGELTSKIDRGIAAYESFIHFKYATFLPLLIEIIVFFSFIGFMGSFYLYPILLACALIFLVIQIKIIKLRRDTISKLNSCEDDISERLTTIIPGIRTIQAFRVEKFFNSIFSQSFSGYKKYSVKTSVSASWISVISFAMCQVSILLSISLGVFYLVPNQQMDIGSLIMSITLTGSLMGSLSTAVSNLRLLDQYRLEYDVATGLFERDFEEGDKTTPLNVDNVKVNVQKQDLASDRSGVSIALVGSSGAGKSTLLKSLLLSSNRDKWLDKIDQNLPQKIGSCSYLDQLDFIYTDSVVNNILMGRNGEVDSILSELNLDERFDKHSIVNGNRNELSGGEARRICLARALINENDWYLLDEPTTGLDGAGAIRAWQTIFERTKGANLVVATHDKSCLNRFDYVVEVVT
jgi:ABC-type multidrug transport system fused ATPase/permease subunit